MSENFDDDFDDGFIGEGIAYSWSDGDACRSCQSGNVVVLQHGVQLDPGYATGALTRPFLGALGWDKRWDRIDDAVDVTTLDVRRIAAFAASTSPSLTDGVVWWRLEGYVDGMRSWMFRYQCRECGLQWSFTDQ